jgi:hypothetical protein
MHRPLDLGPPEAAVLPELSWVTVYETASCGAHYDGRHFRIWKELTLDSAVRLQRAPRAIRAAACTGTPTRCGCT